MAFSGFLRIRLYTSCWNAVFFFRVIEYASLSGSTLRNPLAIASTSGPAATYVGERCSIVTCAASPAIAGTRVTAVAPEPITTTRFPVKSRSSGQACGCTTWPSNRSRPGNSGV